MILKLWRIERKSFVKLRKRQINHQIPPDIITCEKKYHWANSLEIADQAEKLYKNLVKITRVTDTCLRVDDDLIPWYKHRLLI